MIISVGHTTILHVLEIKKIYQRIVNNVNLSVLKLEKRYLRKKWGNQSLQFFWIIHRGSRFLFDELYSYFKVSNKYLYFFHIHVV